MLPVEGAALSPSPKRCRVDEGLIYYAGYLHTGKTCESLPVTHHPDITVGCGERKPRSSECMEKKVEPCWVERVIRSEWVT